MGSAPQVAMRVASQIWQVVFASQTLQVFRLALRKKAQYVVVVGSDGIVNQVHCEVYTSIESKEKLLVVKLDSLYKHAS
jgi:hypothetical protein